MEIQANATNDSESKPNSNIFYYGITFRPNENRICTLGGIRRKYGLYTLWEQKQILDNTIEHCASKGVKFTEIFYEETTIVIQKENYKMVHFHCVFSFKEIASYLALKEIDLLLNKRYSVPEYTAFDMKILDDDDLERWRTYIRKDLKHKEQAWTSGI